MWSQQAVDAARSLASRSQGLGAPRRLLLQTTSESESTRIFGIGIGAFAVLLLCLFSCLICWFGSNTRSPGVISVSTTFVLGILLLILFTTPRGDDSEEVDFEGYDNNFIPRITVMVLVSFGAFCGLVCLMIHLVIPKRQARALNYQRDVLQKY
ncbi:hypothetical protein A3770_01p01670 [Chloropicon primus]|uniref:Transmembrane protein 218 n=1 Tax=Chloropicon primus TaxID=1764295 RepID=A0A5B8MBM1_9CHLO|nr:hypothetical protein A3770_01p01670 [Chloropicon primus]|mmetsp:Transcript_13833/g.39027  ORF Transcript_13833/g.39027 Transcript_13833/m.39027 type:complete len:154 (+) Transcript_13833:324-785(+)|eukprot:QDZ17649.1 hypothetical protein A3770_01p01670 [Chloropicon primus]